MPQTSPARHEPIPNGPATKGGAVGVAVLALVAAYSAFQDGDHSIETVVALASAASVLITIMAGKYHQAAALIRSHGGIGFVVEELGDPSLDSPYENPVGGHDAVSEDRPR
jgi:hypothetical protein